MKLKHLHWHWLFLLFFLNNAPSLLASTDSVVLVINLKGSVEASFQLIGKEKNGRFKEIVSAPFISPGQTTFLEFPQKGSRELLFRANFRRNGDSSIAPMEWPLLVTNHFIQIELNADSLRSGGWPVIKEASPDNERKRGFDLHSKKNAAAMNALLEIQKNKEAYQSDFSKKVENELAFQKKSYSKWYDSVTRKDSKMFVSRYYWVKYWPFFPGTTSKDSLYSYWTAIWMKGLDKADSSYIHLLDFDAKLDYYLSSLLTNVKTEIERDSVLLKASEYLLRNFRNANPSLQSYIADYLFRGFESLHLDAGFQLLQEFVFAKNSSSLYKTALLQKIAASNQLKIGYKVPDIVIKASTQINLYDVLSGEGSTILFFGSATCSHCIEFVSALKSWYQSEQKNRQVRIVAISIDQTDEEKKMWKDELKTETKWVVATTEAGIYSPEAASYGVLSTPSIFLIDNKSGKLLATPDSFKELSNEFSYINAK